MAYGGEQDRVWSALMAAAQGGDGGAYRQLLRDLLPFLRILARRHGMRPDQAEDVVQDVLLTVHRVRHTYDPALPFIPWLASIARRRAIDARRRQGRVGAQELSASDTLETFIDPQANRVIEVQELREWLAKAVAELPEKQRRALELVKFRELSVAEAAAITGQSEGAIKVNTHRAIRALRALLGKD